MSNELFNAHIAMGSPCGDEADMDQIANWAGCVILGDMAELNEMKARADKAEAELAKRERALVEAHTLIVNAQIPLKWRIEQLALRQNFTEWLKNRGKS